MLGDGPGHIGLRDAAAACLIVGGMLVGGPGVGLASAHPDSGRHHGGESGDPGAGQTDGTGNRGVVRRPMSTIGAGTSGRSGYRVPSAGAPLEAGRPQGTAEHRWGGAPIGRNVQVGGGVQLRSGVELDDGVRIGGGVRIGRDTAMLQSADMNASGQQGNGPTSAGPRTAPGNVSTPNLPNAVQPHPNRLGTAAVPGGTPIAGSPPGAISPIPATPHVPTPATSPIPATPRLPATPPVPATPPRPAAPPGPASPRRPAAPPVPATPRVPAMTPVPVMPPGAPGPVFVPPPASSPGARPPSAMPNGPSLSPAPVVQTPPPLPNAPMTSIAPGSPPERLPYRAGYTDYLQKASVTEIAAAAAPGTTGIFLLTGCGVFVGYR
ncbi:MAG: hypothetical protein JOZ49_10530, partial [Mycolicibacterium sp.]|nr:hypothetical protein [Mycolicibacterium sp.]